jgi:GNAT superfamily N-acetyltransferase
VDVRQATATPSARADLRPWPLDASIRHLVMLDVAMIPSVDEVERWLESAYRAVPTDPTVPSVVRTGALYPAAAEAFLARGFVVVDRLALLQRQLTGSAPPGSRGPSSSRGTRRVRKRDLATIARIDQAAFPIGWGNDADSLAGIIAATPQARGRMARDAERTPVGFALTGKAGTTGYLQRIAVRPDARRAGLGRRLVDDALHWLMRRGARRALVNTGFDNRPALRMYEDASFELLDDELLVLEHRRTS